MGTAPATSGMRLTSHGQLTVKTIRGSCPAGCGCPQDMLHQEWKNLPSAFQAPAMPYEMGEIRNPIRQPGPAAASKIIGNYAETPRRTPQRATTLSAQDDGIDRFGKTYLGFPQCPNSRYRDGRPIVGQDFEFATKPERKPVSKGKLGHAIPIELPDISPDDGKGIRNPEAGHLRIPGAAPKEQMEQQAGRRKVAGGHKVQRRAPARRPEDLVRILAAGCFEKMPVQMKNLPRRRHKALDVVVGDLLVAKWTAGRPVG